jgi:hypothetical protein
MPQACEAAEHEADGVRISLLTLLRRSPDAGHRLAAPQDETHGSYPERPTGNQEGKILRPRATKVGDSRALRKTAYAPR